MSFRIQLLAFGVGVLILSPGCGTEPIGVEGCRQIEQARCEAAAQCGLVEDVAACSRFFRDHCLHGVGLAEEPGSVTTERCVSAIRLAGDCAADPKRGPETAPADCSEATFKTANADEICELVEEPERASQCSFLAEEQEQQPELDAPAAEPDAGS